MVKAKEQAPCAEKWKTFGSFVDREFLSKVAIAVSCGWEVLTERRCVWQRLKDGEVAVVVVVEIPR